MVVGGAAVNKRVRGLQATCGDANLPVALEMALTQMAIGEECEVRYSTTPGGRDAANTGNFCLRIRMWDWVVEPVPGQTAHSFGELSGAAKTRHITVQTSLHS